MMLTFPMGRFAFKFEKTKKELFVCICYLEAVERRFGFLS